MLNSFTMAMWQKQSKVKEPENFEHAFAYALFILGLRLRSEGEMRQKMLERGYAAEIIERAVAELTQLDYINDARFAELLVDNFKRFKSYGYYQVKKKLMEKRFSSSLIEQTLESGLPLEDELAVAKRFLAKEGYEAGSGVPVGEKQRMARRLQMRGFRHEVISKLAFR